MKVFYLPFQMMIDCEESVFKFERLSGVLKPLEKQTIILKFVPQHPINYHRRVTCMIHDQVGYSRAVRSLQLHQAPVSQTFSNSNSSSPQLLKDPKVKKEVKSDS